ncbi:hypothetical protein RB594_000769 [Gaeumannomyces avenae]
MRTTRSRDRASMHRLPVEVQDLVLLQLPKEAVLACRLVCRNFLSRATEIAFRHVELRSIRNLWHHPDVVGTPPHIESFRQISEAEHLRGLVHEVTLDAFEGYEASNYCGQRPFLRVLPRLACFRNLRTLNIRFNKIVQRELAPHHHLFRADSIRESTRFRLQVLHIAINALSGAYTDKTPVNRASPIFDPDKLYPQPGHPKFPNTDPRPIGLEGLTIANLSPYDARLIDPGALQTILATPSFRSLKLLVTRAGYERRGGEIMPRVHFLQPENHHFYRRIPLEWLSPAVAQNLRVLSLYDAHYWGWCPVMDFRAINPSGGGLPNLRVLALGRHVFAHDWQVDWIAGLAAATNSTTPAAGLEELYLDDCPIIWHARIKNPNSGSTWHQPPADPETEDLSFQLRWHDVLPRWRDAFAGSRLRVFSMGRGDWKGDAQAPEGAGGIRGTRARRGDGVFLSYDLPPPRKVRCGRFGFRYSYCPRRCEFPCGATPRYGVGLRPARKDVMQYIQFDLDPWPRGKWVEGIGGVDSDTKLLDDQALEDFMETLGLHWSH